MNRKLLAVVTSSVLAVSLLVGGGTYALFSSTATNSNNTLTAGTLNITLDKQDPSGGAYFTVPNMAPGDSEIRPVTISSTGSLQLKYNLSLSVGGVLGTLDANHLTIAAYPSQQEAENGTNAIDLAQARTLDANGGGHSQETLYIKVTLPINANDDYQGASGTASISVNAVQTANNGDPNAVQFSYTDLSGTTAPISGSNADDQSFQINLPFNVNFYGQSFNTLYASTNGLITFNGPDSFWINTQMSDGSTPDNSIAVYWDDLTHATGMYAAYYTVNADAADPYVLIQWKNSQNYVGGNSGINFETKIYESGKIQMFYQSTDFGDGSLNNGASATVGIKKDSTHFQQYSFDQPVITAGKAIQFIAQ